MTTDNMFSINIETLRAADYLYTEGSAEARELKKQVYMAELKSRLHAAEMNNVASNLSTLQQFKLAWDIIFPNDPFDPEAEDKIQLVKSSLAMIKELG